MDFDDTVIDLFARSLESIKKVEERGGGEGERISFVSCSDNSLHPLLAMRYRFLGKGVTHSSHSSSVTCMVS